MAIPSGYVKVSPVFLQAEEPLQVSLYIYMPLNKKVVLFQKKGSILPTEKLFELMKLSSSQILTTIDEAKRAMSAVTGKLVEEIEDSDSITPEASAAASRMVQSLANVEGEDKTQVLQTTKSILDESSELVKNIINIFKTSGTKKGFQNLLNSLKSDGNSLEAHHRHTSALAVLLLLSFGEGNTSDISDLALAAMAHDLGLKEISEEDVIRHVSGQEIKTVINPDPDTGSQIDLQTARTRHIEGTLKVLKEKGIQITDGVYKIISQHHENFDGTGPLGISGRKIYGPARILRIVDDIVCLLNPSTGISDLETAFQSLKKVNKVNNEVRFYDEEIIEQLDLIMHQD